VQAQGKSVDTIPRERLVTTAELFQHLDGSTPAIERARQFLQQSDTSEAVKVLMQYFRTRNQPRYFFAPWEIPERLSSFSNRYPNQVKALVHQADDFKGRACQGFQIEHAMFSRKWVLPGIIDSHVHSLSYPGEGFFNSTRSAAAGGVTTIIDMPVDAPKGISTLESLKRKISLLEQESLVDVALLHAAGQLAGIPFFLSPQADQFQFFRHDAGNLRRRFQPVFAEIKADILAHRQGVQQGGEDDHGGAVLIVVEYRDAHEALELLLNILSKHKIKTS
jgi:hypothetical protein